MNAETVKAEQKKGVPILYGDARQDHIMEAVNIPKARVVVIAISDPEGTKVVVQNIRMVSQSVHLIVRTRFVKEIPELIALGADDVIPEEFETSIEIFSRTLHYFLIPEDDIGHFAEITRSNNYGLFQNKKSIPRTFRPGKYPEFDITCLKVRTDNRRIVGKTLSELDVRNQYGINILGLSRKDTLITNSGPDEILLQRDILYVTGKQESIDQFRKVIE